MIIYCLFFTVVFFTNYFKWKVAIESKFKNYSSFDELFSILLIIISCYILYIWTVFYVSIGIKTLENSVKTNFTVEKLFQIVQTHKEALQHFETDTINGDGAMINGIYYFVIPEEEKFRKFSLLHFIFDSININNNILWIKNYHSEKRK